MKKIVSLALVVLMLATCVCAFASCSSEKNVKIGVQAGTTGAFFLSGNTEIGFNGYSNVDVSEFTTGALAVTDMLNGNVDYVVIDNSVAQALVAANSGKIKMIDYALTTESYGIGVDKNQPELLTAINKVLSEKKDEIKALYTKYASVTDENSAVWSGSTVTSAVQDDSKNQLVVATNAQFAPYEFTVGDKYAGIDMELAKLIADELGMELVIKDMEFDSVVTSIGKNGVDVAISGLTINPARAKVVNFSDPYEEGAYQVIIAKVDDTTFDACKSSEDVLNILASLKK